MHLPNVTPHTCALWKVIHIACYIHSIKTLILDCFTNSPYKHVIEMLYDSLYHIYSEYMLSYNIPITYL